MEVANLHLLRIHMPLSTFETFAHNSIRYCLHAPELWVCKRNIRLWYMYIADWQFLFQHTMCIASVGSQIGIEQTMSDQSFSGSTAFGPCRSYIACIRSGMN